MNVEMAVGKMVVLGVSWRLKIRPSREEVLLVLVLERRDPAALIGISLREVEKG
jgi:hypothetical protein